jgi:hypothetical protein
VQPDPDEELNTPSVQFFTYQLSPNSSSCGTTETPVQLASISPATYESQYVLDDQINLQPGTYTLRCSSISSCENCTNQLPKLKLYVINPSNPSQATYLTDLTETLPSDTASGCTQRNSNYWVELTVSAVSRQLYVQQLSALTQPGSIEVYKTA